MPTKPEQADLLQAMFGRNGESPIPVLAPQSPADCFDVTIEAFRLAVRAMTPVFVLSDGYLANSAEPWALPNPDRLPPIAVHHPTLSEFQDGNTFLPYGRNPETMGRPWALPGEFGLEHRIGGLAKQPGTGNVSYSPEDNDRMIRDRAEKVARLAEFIPLLEVFGNPTGELLVLGWGSSFGAIHQAVERARRDGKSVSAVHLRHLNPFPRNLGEILDRFDQVLVPEMNLGQLAMLLKARYLKPVISMSKVRGRPFKISEISEKIDELLG
jgi:2-oxoglutarate ferredoxin oxidoreductase subunit alpha